MKAQALKKICTLNILMFWFVALHAQIIYTDVIPDTTIKINVAIYGLDLNNDGIIDFNITDSTSVINSNCPAGTPKTGTNIHLRITPLGANEIGNDTTFPGALLLNTDINNSSFKWKNSANQVLTYKSWLCRRAGRGFAWTTSYSGRWNAAVDKYVPLRLQLNSQTYYGWARLDVKSGAESFTVKDYAYNTIADQPILAGKTTLAGISESSLSSLVNLFPNPANNHFTIDLGFSNKKVAVTITDLTGKIIQSTIARETQKIEVNTTDFKEGIYVVRIQTADFVTTKKFVVEK